MDKRTLLFVFALTAVLFGVNLYFENQNQDQLKVWNAQQKAKRTLQMTQLREELSKKTPSVQDLPLVEIFKDDQAKEVLTRGFLTKGQALVVSWEAVLPTTVYTKQGDTIAPMTLAQDPQAKNGVALYSPTASKPEIEIAKLSPLGQLDLLLINLESTPSVKAALYENGNVIILEDQINKLEAQIEGDETPAKQLHSGTWLAITKTLKGFLPVGLYDATTSSLVSFENLQSLSPFVMKAQESVAKTNGAKGEQKYFVIENDFQQLVFSNVGGALVEINLPFQSKKDKESVVKEVDFDREMVKYAPKNALFPAHGYFTPGEKAKELTFHETGSVGGYYPLVRRDLSSTSSQKAVRIPPQFYATNIISEYPEVAETVYEVKEFTKDKIVFESTQSVRKIVKTYSVEPEENGAPYCLNLTVQIEGDSRGLWLVSGVPEVEWISGGSAPVVKYRVTRNDKSEVVLLDLPKESITLSSINPDWVVNSNGFFGVIQDPIFKNSPGLRVNFVPGLTVPSRLTLLSEQHDHFKAADLPGYLTMLPLPTNGGTMEFRIFAGPFSDSVLKQVDRVYSNSETGYNPDYTASQTFHGWFAFISEPFARFLFVLMKFFYFLTGSWGVSIILLTVALRVMLYPLNAWSTKSMVNMQQIAPEVAAIQERYKKDPKKAQLEVMNLYRDRGVNPVSGCLPMLIQIPFLIGMFDLLKSVFELRGASFIPGWIDDLSQPDVLFSWNTPLFFIGNELHLLPIILGGVMFLQQKLSATGPTDPKLMTDQQRQQRAMGSMMAIVFAIMFYNFPSGLNLYWLSSMLLGMLQQWWTTKRLKPKGNSSTLVKVKK